MVTLAKLTKGQAESYFKDQKEDYYSSQAGCVRLHGDKDLWRAIGVDPNTPSTEAFHTALQHSKGRKTQAFDFTISAPKTISLKAVLFRDEKVIEAHREAVEETIKEIQKTTQAKTTRAKDRTTITTGSFIAVEFLHFYNREKEPQLHSHVVISNLTRAPDGKLQSIEPYNWMDRNLHKHFDAIYKAKLAEALKRRGYEVIHNGLYLELKGLEHLKDAFSTRHKQILQQIEKLKPILNNIKDPVVRDKVEYKMKKLTAIYTRQPVTKANLKLPTPEELIKQKAQELVKKQTIKQPERIPKDTLEELMKIPAHHILKTLGFKELERSSTNSKRLKAPSGDIYVVAKNPQGTWMWWNTRTGEGGNNLTLIQHLHNVKFKKAVEYLKNFMEENPHLCKNVEVKLPTLKQTSPTTKPKTLNLEGLTHIPLELNRYIQQRALNLNLLRQTDNVESIAFRGGHGLLFKVVDETGTEAVEIKTEEIKALASGKGIWLSNTKEKILKRFEKDQLTETTIIITESPIDTLSAMELLNDKDKTLIGIATMGPTSHKAVKAIEKLLKDLDAKRKELIKEWIGRTQQEVWKKEIKVFLIFDKDKAGDTFIEKMKGFLSNLKLETITLQVEDRRDFITYGKDINDTLKHIKEIREAIEKQDLNRALSKKETRHLTKVK